MWEEEREEKLQINLWSLQKLVIVILIVSLAKPPLMILMILTRNKEKFFY